MKLKKSNKSDYSTNEEQEDNSKISKTMGRRSFLKNVLVKGSMIAAFVGVPAALFAGASKIDGPWKSNEKTKKPARSVKQKGLDWLSSRQNTNGSFGNDVGITSLALLAFMNAGMGEDNPRVAKGIQYLKNNIQADGSITTGTYRCYHTSLAIMALSATNDPKNDELIDRGAKFLISSQITDGDNSEWQGGFGYGEGGRPDLSNTQFALMALHEVEKNGGKTVPAELWENAVKFVSSCQNLALTNDVSWANDKSLPSYNDGGFTYKPGPDGSKVGGTASYGSITAVGIKSLLICGVGREDIRVSSALNWLGQRYSMEGNPGMDKKALYYYYWTMGRALTLANMPVIVDGNRISHNWHSELVTKLESLQNDKGYWVNTESDLFWEGIPELTTSYILLTLPTYS